MASAHPVLGLLGMSVIQGDDTVNRVDRVRIVFLTAASVAISWTQAQQASAQQTSFSKAVVAADHTAASEAGARILREGGNVVDAAVATSFALSVVRPASCGIGGGGFMVIWDADQQKAVALDYRERAPAGATATALQDYDKSPEPPSVRGGKAVGVPGNVAGLCYAARKYGTMPIARLVQPAIDLCKNGVPIDQHDQEVQATTLNKLKSHAGYEERFKLLKKLYLNDGKPWQIGDKFYSPQLKTLEAIAANGAAGFYKGPVAVAVAQTITAESGIFSTDDLAAYQPTERNALVSKFHGKQIITMPPPSSGGVALLQTLQALEEWETLSQKSLKSLQHNSADYVHVVTEVLKHAFADRAEFLGDTDFVEVPIDKLLNRDYSRDISEHVSMTSTLAPEKYGRFFLNSDGGTSHFSVMDADGNAVACTETINLTFGSFLVVPEYGIILNNELDDFTANPGKPNAFGLIQSEANVIAPGKRPLSSMTPTLVVEDHKATYACGASGGPRIITATLQSLLNHTVFEMSAADAVSASRFHHQWSPNELLLEPSLKKAAGDSLTALGHVVKSSSSLAATQAAALDSGKPSGGSDPRKNGQPAGY
ncbi:MAG: gamma-glutamyltransferase [Planctomycetota bacterium]|nr:MAG: gamma-glutamyltransferase [Planctomycetota bacterium]